MTVRFVWEPLVVSTETSTGGFGRTRREVQILCVQFYRHQCDVKTATNKQFIRHPFISLVEQLILGVISYSIG